MNFTNADNLAPIVKMRRSEKARARGVVCHIQTQQTSTVDMPQVDNLPNVN
jgi:hypothetical protein